jgi:hypothetical protein
MKSDESVREKYLKGLGRKKHAMKERPFEEGL